LTKGKKKAIKANQPKTNGDKRKNNGQFAKGNKAALGHSNTVQQRTLMFKRWFQDAVSKYDVEKIAKNLILIAKSKDDVRAVSAAKEVLDRCMGKAEQRHEVSGVDGEPLPPIQVIIRHGEAKG